MVLITNKEIENTTYHRRIESIGDNFPITDEKYSIILIHGAGSFGHILARNGILLMASEEIISCKERM